jgi:hypothetical protein
MASNQDNKKNRAASAQPGEKARKSSTRTAPSHPRGATTITAVVPVQALAPAQWEQDGDDTLAAALRVFFLSHTLDPLTGEVHTVH